ncbi:LysR family transcriptional regulator [Phaeobacter inhibens]|uniref:LysR family transcriptional regulator n=1 Tax=Phaeobacter inhibens TaxID=221822 RepID=UPI00275EC086|nr:LysR family transcriptional regulator [Phaeobacter inhibens]GLO69927.1 LysR family transcriptional regulator [Phaeobacter inhibens]
MQQLNWDDLCVLLALARAESLAGASGLLNLDPTTVSRRIKAMEKRAGEVLIGKDTPLSGTVRLTAVPFLLNRLLAPRLAEFSRLHPNLYLSLIPDSQNLSLTRREVDIALRFGEPREGGSAVLAQKIGRVTFSVFTAKDVLGVAVEDRPWLVYDPITAHLPQAAWTETLRHQSNGLQSPVLMHDLETAFEIATTTPVRAILPKAVAHRDPCLIEVPQEPKMPDMARDVWLLRHTDMRGAARIDTITNWLVEADLFL